MAAKRILQEELEKEDKTLAEIMQVFIVCGIALCVAITICCIYFAWKRYLKRIEEKQDKKDFANWTL